MYIFIGSQALVPPICIHRYLCLHTYTYALLTLFLKFTYIETQDLGPYLKNQFMLRKNFQKPIFRRVRNSNKKPKKIFLNIKIISEYQKY